MTGWKRRTCPPALMILARMSMALRNWASASEGLCTICLMTDDGESGRVARLRGRKRGVEGAARSSPGSSGAWDRAFSRLRLRR